MEENKEEVRLNEDKLRELVAKGINNIIEDGIQVDEIDTLGKLVDIHKDLANEDYWQDKKEAINMRYRNYGEYGRDNYSRDGYGRDNYGRDNYGRRRRDSRGRYAGEGEEIIDEMYNAYKEYSMGKEDMNMGNYGAKSDTMKSLDCMMKGIVEFVETLKKEANSQEEVKLIEEYAREISEM